MNNPQTTLTSPVFQAITWRDDMTATSHGYFQSLLDAWKSFDHLYPASPRVQEWGGDYSEVHVIVNDQIVDTIYFADPTGDDNNDRYFGFDLTTPSTIQVDNLIDELAAQTNSYNPYEKIV